MRKKLVYKCAVLAIILSLLFSGCGTGKSSSVVGESLHSETLPDKITEEETKELEI